ncbi:MAG: hypothetical protein HZA06_04550 [Nitrospirae bacterium]|nr:hypothetical protein [Nitrospirota bacterium]
MRTVSLNCRGVWQYAPIIIILIFIASCTQKIAEVGDITITDKDISHRAKVSEVYYPNSGKGYIALAQLINGYLSEEILKSLGHKIDEEVLEKETKRIDENTKAPETLKNIKDVYGRNRKGYIKTFVRIVYAERALYNEVFLKSKEIHKEQYFKAEGFIKKAIKSPNSFQNISKRMGLESKRLKISLKEGIMPYEDNKTVMKPQTPIGIEQAEMLINKISKTKAGEIYPEIIEWLEGYQIIRYIKKDGDYYIIESVSISKRNYDDWFYDKTSKIPVRIYDKKLKDELLKEVSWGKRLKLE